MEDDSRILIELNKLRKESDRLDRRIDELRYQGVPYSNSNIQKLLIQRDEVDEKIIALQENLDL